MSEANWQRGQEWLTQVLALMGIPALVEITPDHRLDIATETLTSEQQAILLEPVVLPGSSDRDETITLDALQYLSNTLLNLHRPATEQQSFTLDLGGYRQHRWITLQDMIVAAINQVRSSGTEYEWGYLSAAERRQVHAFLEASDYEDLESISRGKEPDRRLVIRRRDPLPS